MTTPTQPGTLGASPTAGAVSLRVDALSKDFGGVSAVDNLSFTHDSGGVFGLLGPNGAGKTTLFNLMSGMETATSGSVRVNDVEVTRLRPDQVAHHGIARTFQNLQIFESLTVLENVYVARTNRMSGGVWPAILGLRRTKRLQAQEKDYARHLLERVGLDANYHNVGAATLPYGLQRRVEIARALATEPQLLLLDEPLAGLSRAESADLLQLVHNVADQGTTVLLVEHDVASVMDVSNRILVLDQGRLLADGPPATVRDDPNVRAAYLGEELAE